MNTHENNRHFFSMDISKQRLIMTTQLVTAAATIHHVDELFRWLAYAIVHRFDVQIMQVWTYQGDHTGQLAVLSRILVCQDSTLPEHVVVNDQTAKLAFRIASERRSYMPQPVDSMFSLYQSTLLKRYGLNYCISYFTGRNIFLPPQSAAFSQGCLPALFATTTWLFLQQSPHADLTPTIGLILEQAVALAENHGLLFPVAANARQSTIPPPSPQQEPPSIPAELIPRHRQDASFLLASNPLANPIAISDKKARRLYAAIDGHRSVADLCSVTGMDMKELSAALQRLLDQHRIELYAPGGRRVSLLPDNR